MKITFEKMQVEEMIPLQKLMKMKMKHKDKDCDVLSVQFELYFQI